MEDFSGKRWAPLEAKKPPWPMRRPANCQQQWPAAEDQDALSAEREELANITFAAERNAARLEQIEQGNIMEPVLNIQVPVWKEMLSLQEMRAQLRNQITARPRLVTIEGKTPGTVYVHSM